jgi:histidine phosphotransferase ChpT
LHLDRLIPMPRQGLERFTPDAAFIGAGDRAPPSGGGSDAVLSQSIDMRVLELLTTRLCHELSGPITAINNGIELLFDEDSGLGAPPAANFLNDAVALVNESARRARHRLQFYRFAYGFGRLGASTGPAPHELAAGFFAASEIVCDYAESVRMMPQQWQKLACNLLPVGADALPRGGRLSLTDDPFTVQAVGESAAFSPEVRAALMVTTPINELTARTVQAYFAGLLAKALDCRLIATAKPGRVRLTAISAAI